jgi:hypothetical protein
VTQSTRIISGEKDPVKVSSAFNQLAEKFDRLLPLDISNLTGSAWTTYTPTVSASSGTITSYTVNSARYQKIGKTVLLQLDITITNNGTGAGSVRVTVPVTATTNAYFLTGRENLVTGKMLVGPLASSSQFAILYYDNTYPGGTGNQLQLSGMYEAA